SAALLSAVMSDPPASPDLMRAWADISAQWSQWWTQASGLLAPGAETTSTAIPQHGLVDFAARATLDARYAAQWEALWRAAQAALAAPIGGPLPEGVAARAGGAGV